MQSNLEILQYALEQRDAIRPWPAGRADLLLDLAADPNRYLWEMAHDIPLLPGLSLLIAVSAVERGFGFDPLARPGYRRWTIIPSAQTLASAVFYALEPPEIEEVEVRDLRDHDLVVLGREPYRLRKRVSGHINSAGRTCYTLAPLDAPHLAHRMDQACDARAFREQPHAPEPWRGTGSTTPS